VPELGEPSGRTPDDGGQIPLVFDLHRQSMDRVRTVQSLRRLLTLLLVIVIGLLLWFVAIGLTEGVAGFQWAVLVVVLGCLLFLIGEFLLVLWKTKQGAVGVAVRVDGLEFTWASGATEVLPWKAVCRGFSLRDDSEVEIVRAHSSNLWELRRWNRPITSVSKEAFDAILHAASRHGIVPLESTLRTSPFRWTPTRAIRFSISGRIRRA
jgi:hypothetical protein